MVSERFFKPDNNGYCLNKTIRDLVRFVHGNILNSAFFVSAACYDIIFCRNLLIYFDRPTQAKALTKIHSLLKQNGVLFIGHGEAGCMEGQNYTRVGKPSVFAYTKTSKKLNKYPKKAAKRPLAPKRRQRGKTKGPCVNRTSNADLKLDINKHEKLLSEAKRLANEGRLDEAEIKCQESLRIDGVSADVFYLQAVICDAQGNRDAAEQLYKRALYLCPDHSQSLMHLASHAEREGNMEKAALYRNRAAKSVIE